MLCLHAPHAGAWPRRRLLVRRRRRIVPRIDRGLWGRMWGGRRLVLVVRDAILIIVARFFRASHHRILVVDDLWFVRTVRLGCIVRRLGVHVKGGIAISTTDGGKSTNRA